MYRMYSKYFVDLKEGKKHLLGIHFLGVEG